MEKDGLAISFSLVPTGIVRPYKKKKRKTSITDAGLYKILLSKSR